MKILVFINENQYQDSDLAEILSEMSQQDMKFEILDSTKMDHQNKFDLYAIMQTPAIVVCQDDGKPVDIWQDNLPRIDQIAHAIGYV